MSWWCFQAKPHDHVSESGVGLFCVYHIPTSILSACIISGYSIHSSSIFEQELQLVLDISHNLQFHIAILSI